MKYVNGFPNTDEMFDTLLMAIRVGGLYPLSAQDVHKVQLKLPCVKLSGS